MHRRALLGLACAACAETALARQPSAPPRFLPLKTPVVVPLSALGSTWATVRFKARFTRSDGADSVVPGIAIGTPQGAKAFCAYCPHELCVIALNDDHLLRCPCHFSLFDPQRDGAWISGPAMRRTYPFESAVGPTELTVTGIDADLEKRLM